MLLFVLAVAGAIQPLLIGIPLIAGEPNVYEFLAVALRAKYRGRLVAATVVVRLLL